MPININCQHCGATLAVPDHLVYQTVRCGRCGSVTVANPAPGPVITVAREPGKGVGGSVAALVLGIIGLVAWCLPILGFPVNLIGLILGCVNVHKNSEGRGMAVAGIVMSTIGLCLSVINAVLGGLMMWQNMQMMGH